MLLLLMVEGNKSVLLCSLACQKEICPNHLYLLFEKFSLRGFYLIFYLARQFLVRGHSWGIKMLSIGAADHYVIRSKVFIILLFMCDFLSSYEDMKVIKQDNKLLFEFSELFLWTLTLLLSAVVGWVGKKLKESSVTTCWSVKEKKCCLKRPWFSFAIC